MKRKHWLILLAVLAIALLALSSCKCKPDVEDATLAQTPPQDTTAAIEEDPQDTQGMAESAGDTSKKTKSTD